MFECDVDPVSFHGDQARRIVPGERTAFGIGDCFPVVFEPFACCVQNFDGFFRNGAVGFRAVGGEVLAVRAAMRASAGMRGPWCGRGVGRLRRAGVCLPGWRFRRAALFVRQPHLYLLRFAFPQCDLSAHQFKHDGISHGGAEDFPDAFSRDKSHFTQSGAERPATFYM